MKYQKKIVFFGCIFALFFFGIGSEKTYWTILLFVSLMNLALYVGTLGSVSIKETFIFFLSSTSTYYLIKWLVEK